MPITEEQAKKDLTIAGSGLDFGPQETESERRLREAQTTRLGGQTDIDKAALDLRREQMNLDASLQRASLDLQAKVKRGELNLQSATVQLDRFYKQATLQQQERIARGQALAQARQLQLQAAPWMVKKGQQYFTGFEPTGLASQIAQRFGMKFDAPEIAPIEFTPLADVEKTFAGANLEIPDVLKGLDFGFVAPDFSGASAINSYRDRGQYLTEEQENQRVTAAYRSGLRAGQLPILPPSYPGGYPGNPNYVEPIPLFPGPGEEQETPYAPPILSPEDEFNVSLIGRGR